MADLFDKVIKIGKPSTRNTKQPGEPTANGSKKRVPKPSKNPKNKVRGIEKEKAEQSTAMSSKHAKKNKNKKEKPVKKVSTGVAPRKAKTRTIFENDSTHQQMRDKYNERSSSSSSTPSKKPSTVEEDESTNTPITPGTPGTGSSDGFVLTSGSSTTTPTSAATSALSTLSVAPLPETPPAAKAGKSMRKPNPPAPNAVSDTPGAATSVKHAVTTSSTGSADKWSGEGVAKAWLDKADFAKAKSDFDKIQGLVVNVEKECKKWKTNGKLNQSDDYPALDSNLVKLENEYVNMSQVDVSLNRPVLMGQLPVKGSEETFWKAVFEKRATSIHILIRGDESIDFFPQKTEDYKNYGQMWVNNRRVEVINKDLSRFLIEVLPHGCSNSIVCNVTVIRNWSIDSVHEKQAVVVKETIELTNFLTQSLNEETALIVSHHGAGRAGYFLALAVALNKLEAKTEPCIADIVKTIRSQRPKAVESLVQYVSLYIALMYYIKKKMARGGEGDKKANNSDPLTKKAIEVSLQFETALIAEAAQPSLMANITNTTTGGSTVLSVTTTSAKM